MNLAHRAPKRQRFCVVLVKPSHYDESGYVIQWLRSPIPSNSLASLYGLAKDCAERGLSNTTTAGCSVKALGLDRPVVTE